MIITAPTISAGPSSKDVETRLSVWYHPLRKVQDPVGPEELSADAGG